MKIDTGKGFIGVWALLGIWSVSALTSLPGLAISPILGDLSTIFKNATELDIQLLTSLPSLLIIPFILLAGKLSDAVGYIRLLRMGLWVFLLSGLLYFFCDTINGLILVSVLLGIGAGIITPLSTSLVSRFFVGRQRTRQFGYSSAVNNLSLVVATVVTGYLAEIEWRLPFLVYLLPALSLMLVCFIQQADAENVNSANNEEFNEKIVSSFVNYCALRRYMAYYFLITFVVMAVSVYLPFMMEKYGYDSGTSGVVIALFFLFIMLPGLVLDRIVAFLGRRLPEFSLLLIACGRLIVFLSRGVAGIVVGVLLAGVGYGIAQPYLYDRTAEAASPDRATFALALVMTMNYVAIVLSPVVVDSVQKMLGAKSAGFAFLLNFCICIAALIVVFIWKLSKSRSRV